jgi:membrane-associated protease RseP (regulator of RpoE activity)
MCVALPLTAIGLAVSKPLAASAVDRDVIFGTPLAVLGLHHLLPALSTPADLAQVQPHPVLLAGWVGLFATALNLIPGGQLDGGHILYALRPERHRRVTRWVAVALLLMGVFAWAGWILWGIALLTPMFRHPHVPARPELTRRQRWVAALALLIFAVTFQPSPFQHESGVEMFTGSSSTELYHHWRQRHAAVVRPRG